MQYLKTKQNQTAHKFELMEITDMSPRTFESFKPWILWKCGANMKYENNEFHYLPDLEEEVIDDEEIVKDDEIVIDEEVVL